jgi:hypothetical protein
VNFAACSGATTQQIADKQLGSLSSNTEVVTISAGGDNREINMFGILKQCVQHRFDSDAKPCESEKLTPSNLTELQSDLVTLYQIVRAKAKSAKILVMGYPNPLPATAPSSGGCPGLNAFGFLNVVQDEDIGFLHGLIEQLDATVDAAVSASGMSNIYYVAPPGSGTLNSFVGHDMCTTPTSSSYFVPLGGQGAPGHPNTQGQALMAGWLTQEAGAPPS